MKALAAVRPELLLAVIALAGCSGSEGTESGGIAAAHVDGIFLIELESGEVREVPDLNRFSRPVVSPDGEWLALDRGGDLYRVRVDGTGLRRVIRNGWDASWSPDGKRLVFVRDACYWRGDECLDVFDDPGEIAVVDADGSNLRRLTFDLFYQGSPDWSPDGRRIAYVGDAGVYLMDPDGDNARLLVRGEFNRPRWSPDGSRLVLQAPQSRPAASMLIVDVESGRRTVLRTPRGPLHSPDWSSDGEQIVYAGLRVDGWTAHEALQIWVMDADGRNAHPVTKSFGWGEPSWAARD